MTVYSCLGRFYRSYWLYSPVFVAVQVVAGAELLFALTMFKDNKAVVLHRVISRFLFLQCLWCVFRRVAQRAYCHHKSCDVVAINAKTEDEEGQSNRRLVTDAIADILCLAPVVVLVVKMMISYRAVTGEEYPYALYLYPFMGFSLAIQVLLVQLLLTVLYFESQECVKKCSCPDVLLWRWSVLKGTVVAMTAGISFTASARVMQNAPMAKSFSYGTTALGSLALFCATSNIKTIKYVSIAVSTIYVSWIDPVKEILPSLQLIWFLGSIGLLLNIVFHGHVIQWFQETKRLIVATLLISGAVVLYFEAYQSVFGKPILGILLLLQCFYLLSRLGFHEEFL